LQVGKQIESGIVKNIQCEELIANISKILISTWCRSFNRFPKNRFAQPEPLYEADQFGFIGLYRNPKNLYIARIILYKKSVFLYR